MKKALFISAIFLSFALITSLVFPSEQANAKSFLQKNITVVGEAQIQVDADKAKISFGVEVLQDTLSQAEKNLWEKVESIKTSLQDFEIEKESLVTENFFAYKDYAYENKEQKFLGYKAQASLYLTVSNFEILPQLLSSIAENATSFNGVNFFKEDTKSHYAQALSQALENANEKAQALSNGKSVYLSKISEESFHHHNAFFLENLRNFNQKITITAKVKAIFSFENPTHKDTANLYNNDTASLYNEENTDSPSADSSNLALHGDFKHFKNTAPPIKKPEQNQMQKQENNIKSNLNDKNLDNIISNLDNSNLDNIISSSDDTNLDNTISSLDDTNLDNFDFENLPLEKPKANGGLHTENANNTFETTTLSETTALPDASTLPDSTTQSDNTTLPERITPSDTSTLPDTTTQTETTTQPNNTTQSNNASQSNNTTQSNNASQSNNTNQSEVTNKKEEKSIEKNRIISNTTFTPVSI